MAANEAPIEHLLGIRWASTAVIDAGDGTGVYSILWVPPGVLYSKFQGLVKLALPCHHLRVTTGTHRQ